MSPTPALADRPRVLCVDDEPHVLDGLTLTLRRSFDVVTAVGGEAGLAAMRDRGPFAVVVSDLRMPGLDGATFLARARDLDPDAVRMLLTGHADLDGAIAAINDGGVARFLTKPCAPDELVRRVGQAVEARKLAERERELLRAEVTALSGQLAHADRLATLGTMAAQVGHEINNVLAALQTGLAVIRETVAAGEMPDDEDIRTLLWAKEHLVEHAGQLLAMGRPQPKRDVRVDLGAAARKVVKMLTTAGVLRRLDVTLTAPEAAVWLRLDPTRLEQVLVNLMKNAADALVEAKRRDLVVEVAVDVERRRGVVRVADRGAGIPADALEQIFLPYYTTKPAGKGTGLGLPVVRQIVEGYGGKISVASQVGEGTTFTVELPLDPDPA